MLTEVPWDGWAGWWEHSPDAAFARMLLAGVLLCLVLLCVVYPLLESTHFTTRVKNTAAWIVTGVMTGVYVVLCLRKRSQLIEDKRIGEQEDANELARQSESRLPRGKA